jgi:putative redox protein
MTKMHLMYEKDLRCNVRLENGKILITDGPKELGGYEENYSPTDLFAASLCSCILTMMGLTAKKNHLSFDGAKASIEKEMSIAPPRRISKMQIEIHSKLNPSTEDKKKLEDAANHCPVHNSIHPDIDVQIEFFWNSSN